MSSHTFTVEPDADVAPGDPARFLGRCTCGYGAVGGDSADVIANLEGHDHNDVPPPEV